jgi:hypothetical protein
MYGTKIDSISSIPLALQQKNVVMGATSYRSRRHDGADRSEKKCLSLMIIARHKSLLHYKLL